MADPVTQNKALAQPPNAADPGTWDVPMNNNADAIDSSLGDVTILSAQGLSGVQPLLTPLQYRPANLVITGTPTQPVAPNPPVPVVFLLPVGVGGFYFVSNLCAGSNAAVRFGSATGGTPTSPTTSLPTVSVPGIGVGAVIVIDPTYGARRADSIAEEAAGPVGAVQYAGPDSLFAGSAGLLYNATTQGLTIGGGLIVGAGLSVGGHVTSRLIIDGGGANTLSVAIAYSANSMAMDCSKSNVFTSTLSGNVTGAVAISHQSDGQTINWRIQQDATGHRMMAWPANFRWPKAAGAPAGGPALSTGPNAVDLLVATFFSGTGTWLASLLTNFVP